MNFQRFTSYFLAFAMLVITGCASGSAVVTGTTRPPLAPTQVKLFLEAPTEFEVIGLVSASSDAGWTEQGSVDYAIAELQEQAAKLGANGVLLESSRDKTTTVVGGHGTGFLYAVPVTAKTLQGRAIYVKVP